MAALSATGLASCGDRASRIMLFGISGSMWCSLPLCCKACCAASLRLQSVVCPAVLVVEDTGSWLCGKIQRTARFSEVNGTPPCRCAVCSWEGIVCIELLVLLLVVLMHGGIIVSCPAGAGREGGGDGVPLWGAALPGLRAPDHVPAAAQDDRAGGACSAMY